MKDIPTLEGRFLTYNGFDRIEVDSDGWYQFLRRGIHFRFVPKQQGVILLHNVNFRCNAKLGNNYWYGVRKVNNRARQEYLGKHRQMTYANILEVCHKLSLGDYEYWSTKINEKRDRESKKKYAISDFESALKIICNKVNENYDGYTEKNAALLITDVLYLATKLTTNK